MKVAVCLVVKNEQTEIIYWIAWYKALGFDTFIIYDDFSSDKTERVILSLIPYIDIKYMRNSVNHDLHNIRQVRAYNDAISRYGKDFDWIALFDADEYLDIYGSDIKSYLRQFETVSLIAFNWCNAGTNGHMSRPEGPPFLSYINHGSKELFWNRHTKVIFRPEKLYRDIYQVHNVPVHGESVDSEGIPIQWDSIHGGFTKNSPTWGKARLIHYQSRSIEHYVIRDRNLEDIRRDHGDPLHAVAKGQEYNSVFTSVDPVNLEKFYSYMLRFSMYQSLVILNILRASSPGFLSQLSMILSSPLVPVFQPAYVPQQHEIDNNWISSNHEPGNFFRDIVETDQGVIAFTVKNAFGKTLGSRESKLCLSDNLDEHLIGLYFPGSAYVHLFSQQEKGFRVHGDARLLPALTYMAWGKGDNIVALSHPRTGRFLGFTPDGNYSVRKIRALEWECFQLDYYDLKTAPSHIQKAANWLGRMDSLQALRETCDPQKGNPLVINAITALDAVSKNIINFLSQGILGEHLL